VGCQREDGLGASVLSELGVKHFPLPWTKWPARLPRFRTSWVFVMPKEGDTIMVSMRTLATCPWRGPEPCLEEDARRFFGRTRDLRELLHSVSTQRLTVLTAATGAGKTSLIQAGLIPAMRLWRERAPGQMGTALCLRNWAGHTREGSAASIIRAIRAEVRRLDGVCTGAQSPAILGLSQLSEDLKSFAAAESSMLKAPLPEILGAGKAEESLLRYVGKLCDALAGHRMVLLFDQAEELLGSGLRVKQGIAGPTALDEIGLLFRSEERVTLVVSLREEYVARLRPLELLVSSLGRECITCSR